jgi:hypothetical protein
MSDELKAKVDEQINTLASLNFLTQAFEALKSNVDIITPILRADNATKDLAKSIGVSSERFDDIKKSIILTRGEIIGMAGGLEDAAKIQLDFMDSMQTNTTLNEEYAKKMFAITKVLGVSTKEVSQNFANAGFNMKGATDAMQITLDVSRKIGVNAQRVSEQVVDNIGKMNQFTFQGGVDGLAKMAAQAVNLRFNMNQTLTLADKLFDPENAIEMAASMQRLGVAQSDLLDPLRLMDLAQNDPAELQNQLIKMSEQFVQLNAKGQFEIMPGARRQLMEISKALGMNYDEITKMAIASSDLDKKMREISFPKDAISEEDKNLIANMATLNKDGSGYEVTFRTKTAEGGYETVTKSTAELTEDDIKLLGDASQPKNLEDIAKEQLTVSEKQLSALLEIQHRAGYALAPTEIGRTAVKTMEIPPETIGKMTKDVFPFDELINDLNTGSGKLFETLGKTFDVMIGEGGSFEGLIVSLNEMGTSLEENIGDKGKKAFDSLTESFKKFTEENKTFGEAFKKISDAIKNLEGGESPDNNNSSGETKKIPGKDVLIQTLPEDSIREVGGNVTVAGTNLDGNMNQPDLNSFKSLFEGYSKNMTDNSPKEIKMSLAVDFNINSTNPNIDTNTLKLALNDSAVMREILLGVEKMGSNLVSGHDSKSSPHNYSPNYGSYS